MGSRAEAKSIYVSGDIDTLDAQSLHYVERQPDGVLILRPAPPQPARASAVKLEPYIGALHSRGQLRRSVAALANEWS